MSRYTNRHSQSWEQPESQWNPATQVPKTGQHQAHTGVMSKKWSDDMESGDKN